MAHPARIDVHQHIVPPLYAAWLRSRGLDAGGLPIPEWSAESALAMMDARGIARGVLSVSAPGVHLGDAAEARRMARALNEFTAEVARARPDRFGFFATLTLPDIEGALAEVAYALDHLGADGVVLLANAQGRYLGDPEFAPLFTELDGRGAIVFVHPAALPGPQVPGLPAFVADFLLDTTRAAAELVRAGVMRRHRDLRIILAHAGGFVPYAAERLALTLAFLVGRPVEEVRNELRRFYFDTALSTPAALPSLLAFAAPGHVLFGSDSPYAPPLVVEHFATALDTYDGLDAAGHAAIDRANALALSPRLAGGAPEGASHA
ncbi:MAG TPA: amidohydrolase family protein [Candidatus Binatia bacterium]|jgi:predicted TIM-barrel fold metal-dependent hydrolase